jgi:HEAT repeat protein
MGRSREPRYQGKTAAQWFQAFELAKTNYNRVQIRSFVPMGQVTIAQVWLPASNSINRTRIQAPALSGQSQMFVTSRLVGTSNFVSTVRDDFALAQDHTVNGLRALGTNAALYLAQEIRRGESPWTSWYQTKFAKLPAGLKRVAPDPPAPRALIQNDAAFVLGNLGIATTAAMPILIEGLKDSNPASRVNCIAALQRLNFRIDEVEMILQEIARKGNRRQALEIANALGLHTPLTARLLAEDLANPDLTTRKNAAQTLKYFGPNAKIVAPNLAASLKDSSEDVRFAAAGALEALGPDAEVAALELADGLKSEDSEMRYLCARALSCIGTGAVVVLPALIQATNDSHEMVRRAATRALGKIGQRGSLRS